jgi:hypothetical protein
MQERGMTQTVEIRRLRGHLRKVGILTQTKHYAVARRIAKRVCSAVQGWVGA